MLTRYSILREVQTDPDVIIRRLSVSANQSIIKEGALGNCLYLIERGRVRVLTRVKLNGRKNIRPGLRDLRAGDLFGETSLFFDGRHATSVVAVDDTELLEFEAQSLLGYLDKNPQKACILLQQLLQLLTQRLIQADHRLKSVIAWGLEVHGIDKYL